MSCPSVLHVWLCYTICLSLQISYASMINHHQRTCLGYKTLVQNIWWVFNNQMFYRILCWLKQVDFSPSFLLISLCWLKEETQTSAFVFPRTDSRDNALYYNMKRQNSKSWEILKSIFEAYFSIIIYLSIYYPWKKYV